MKKKIIAIIAVILVIALGFVFVKSMDNGEIENPEMDNQEVQNKDALTKKKLKICW